MNSYNICYNDTSCDCFYIIDVCKGKTTYEYDDRFVKITGYNSISEMTGKDFLQIIHRDDLDNYRNTKARISEKNPFETLIMRLIKKDGSVLRVRCSLIRTTTEDKYDRIIHAFSILENSECLRQHIDLIQSMQPLMFKFRASEKFPFFYNDSFLKTIGFSRDEISTLKLSYTDFMSSRDTDHFLHAIRSAKKSDTISACTVRIIDKVGNSHWLNCSFKKISTSPDSEYFIGIGADITEQKQAESELMKSKMILQSLTENLSCATFVLNNGEDRAEILRFNTGFQKMLGYSDAEIEACSKDICRLIIYRDDQDKFMNAMMQGRSDDDNICRAVASSGKIIWLRFCSFRTFENDRPCFVCTFTDITQQKELESKMSAYMNAFADAIAYTERIAFSIDFTNDILINHDVFIKKHNLPPVITNVPQKLISTGMIQEEFADEITSAYYNVKNGSPEETCIIKVTMPNQSSEWAKLKLSAIFDGSSKVIGAIGVLTDISDQIIAEENILRKGEKKILHDEKLLFACMVNLSQCRILTCKNFNTEIISVPEQMIYNSSFISSFILSVYHEDRTIVADQISLQNLWTNYINAKKHIGFEFRIKKNSDEFIWAKADVDYVKDQLTNDIILTINITDISETKNEKESRLYSPCTVTPDRILTKIPFRIMVDEALRTQQSSDNLYALYLLDLNGFREINKTFGYETGDKIIQAIADELLKMTRFATIGKMYGDEFLIFVKDITSYDDLNITAKQICGICKRIRIPGIDHEAITGCVGVAYSPAHGTDFDTLYEKADKALYNAKRFDKTHYAIYSVCDDENSESCTSCRKKSDSKGMNIDDFKKEAATQIRNSEKIYHLYNADIKHFRNINHYYGYERGDRILEEICSVLNNLLRPGECFTRIFADNFLVLTVVNSQETVERRINEIQSMLYDLPLAEEHRITFSAGLVTIDDSNRYIEFDRLLDCAIVAHENAKKKEGTSFIHFQPGMSDKDIQKYEVLSELKEAIKLGQICTFVQPQFDILNREYVSMEALVRWNHPVKGLLTPDKFISICEENGFISNIDFCVLEQMCSYIRNRLDQDLRVLPVAVNQSQITIHEPGYFKRITSLVEKYNIPPKYIELEVTESAYVNRFDETISVLTSLRDYGFRISMDDFGSGYSSLNLLKDIPVDALKIDRAFLTKNLVEKKPTEILKSITNMAHNINIKVVCEGVEYPQQLQFLQKIGCELVQGYLFGKPMPYDEVADFIESNDDIWPDKDCSCCL